MLVTSGKEGLHSAVNAELCVVLCCAMLCHAVPQVADKPPKAATVLVMSQEQKEGLHSAANTELHAVLCHAVLCYAAGC